MSRATHTATVNIAHATIAPRLFDDELLEDSVGAGVVATVGAGVVVAPLGDGVVSALLGDGVVGDVVADDDVVANAYLRQRRRERGRRGGRGVEVRGTERSGEGAVTMHFTWNNRMRSDTHQPQIYTFVHKTC